MSGYNYKRNMSNNAVDEYQKGGKPKTKWTKELLINAISKILKKVNKEDFLPLILELKVETLRDGFLEYQAWHHTSSYYRRTNFYRIDENRTANISENEINDLKNKEKSRMEAKRKASKQPRVVREAIVHYLEWGGTKSHPKATEIVAKGTVYFKDEDEEIDKAYFIADGDAKKHRLSARGSFVEKYLDDGYLLYPNGNKEIVDRSPESVEKKLNNMSLSELSELKAIKEEMYCEGEFNMFSKRVLERMKNEINHLNEIISKKKEEIE